MNESLTEAGLGWEEMTSVGQEGLGWVWGREQIRVKIRRSRVMIRHEIRKDSQRLNPNVQNE